MQILRAAADAGDEHAAGRLAELLAGRGDLDGLRARADAGDGFAARRLAELLAERGDLDGAARPGRRRRLRTPPGSWPGCWPDRGDLDGLRARADAGDGYAAGRLAELLAERGDLDELRARADAGDRHAARQLAGLLAERGDLDGAVQILRAAPTPATGTPPEQLAGLLAERGDLDGLRARADAGDGYAAVRLAGLLAERGDLDGAPDLRAGPTPATRRPPGGWPSCWPSAATWTEPRRCAPGRRRRRVCRLAAGQAAGRAR